MSLARTMNPKHLVITHDPEQYKQLAIQKQWTPREYKNVTKEEDLAGFHFFPVQNCYLHIFGNHPVMTTEAFRNLLLEKAIK